MRVFFTGLFLFAMFQASFAQSTSVKGNVMDTLEKKPLTNAVISLLQKSDSTLAVFTRSDAKGNFLMEHVQPGKYILLVSYPRFADFGDIVEVKAGADNDLGRIPLTLKSSLLDAVVIRSAGSIRIKGDTTEFIADSFHVKDGATVEDLLKKLPGFQVNSKGEVTTQGQRVGKVLVDGEEFFGDDPTMATQNISAKAVDKVQVFDTKTEQQNLTGITTGNEGKTVNIKLKDDAKKGSFGKAHAASDFTKYVDAKALYNRFVGKKKISLYGTKSDISTGSLNWEDKQKLGMDNDLEYDEISGYYFSFSSGDEFSEWSLRGLPHSYTAGGLFSNKWQEDRNSFNGSYRYNRLATNNESSTLTQNILSTGITYRNKYQNTDGLVQQHSPMLKYEWKLDSLTSFKFSTFLTYKTNRLHSSTQSEFLDSERSRINYSDQGVENNSEKMQQDNQLTYRQMFNKKNRLLIATFRYGTIRDRQNSYVATNTQFYENGLVDSIEIADQQKINRGDSRTMGGKITWSEPLSSTWSLVLEYSLNANNSISHKNTFNKDFSGKYVNLDSAFSNNFELDVLGHSGTTIFKYTDKKLRAAFGAGISLVNLDLKNTDVGTRSLYHFRN
jgi:hypothetical protein